VGDAIVGVVANPLSGRDIRRLVTQASVFPTAEKANMIQRMLTAFGAVGGHRVLLGTDLGGISAAVLRAIGRRAGQATAVRWPEVEFLDGQPIRQTAQDTVDAATGAVPAATVTSRAKLLEVRAGDRVETALVDVAVSTERHVGARAVWDPATVTQLFCAFAEPDAIGLSSICGQLFPVSRHEPHGVTARIAPGAARRVLAPIAPGLVVPVGVAAIGPVDPGTGYPVQARAGVIAVDGERELTFGPGCRPEVRLRADGPRCVDVPAVLAASARLGLLAHQPTEDA
jgi:predicted polyphosphate/ATP-dependent NAD kinase